MRLIVNVHNLLKRSWPRSMHRLTMSRSLAALPCEPTFFAVNTKGKLTARSKDTPAATRSMHLVAFCFVGSSTAYDKKMIPMSVHAPVQNTLNQLDRTLLVLVGYDVHSVRTPRPSNLSMCFALWVTTTLRATLTSPTPVLPLLDQRGVLERSREPDAASAGSALAASAGSARSLKRGFAALIVVTRRPNGVNGGRSGAADGVTPTGFMPIPPPLGAQVVGFSLLDVYPYPLLPKIPQPLPSC